MKNNTLKALILVMALPLGGPAQGGNTHNQNDDLEPINKEILNRRLSDAVLEGDLLNLIALIEEGVDVNELNNDGEPPLYSAVKAGHLDSVRLLLEHGADPNARTCESRLNTPLLAAIDRNRLDIVRLLLEHGAHVNGENDCGEIPMWETPLSFAATYGYYEIVAFLCANNADVNVASSRERHTPLHEAVLAYLRAPTEKRVYIQIANVLCKWGATITLEDARGMTPLNYAYQAHERRMRRAQTIINALIEAIESAQDNTTEVVPSDLTIETRNIVVLSGRSRVPNPHNNNNNDDSVIDEDDEIARNLASGMRSFLQ